MEDLKKELASLRLDDEPPRSRRGARLVIERPPTDKGAAMTKPSEIVNVHYMVDDVDDRRTFIKGVGLAVLTVQFLPLIGHASGNPPSDGKETADNVIIQSGPGLFHHVHDLLIPYAVLKAPPLKGVELITTQAMFHRHNIVLTREQLMTVNKGGTVTQKASSHLFVIALAKRQNHIQAAIATRQPHC